MRLMKTTMVIKLQQMGLNGKGLLAPLQQIQGAGANGSTSPHPSCHMICGVSLARLDGKDLQLAACAPCKIPGWVGHSMAGHGMKSISNLINNCLTLFGLHLQDDLRASMSIFAFLCLFMSRQKSVFAADLHILCWLLSLLS